MNLRPAVLFFFALTIFVTGLSRARAAAPVVSNVRAAQRVGTQLVDVYYDLADADSSALTVSVAVSTNGGATFDFPATSFSGALGNGYSPSTCQWIT